MHLVVRCWGRVPSWFRRGTHIHPCLCQEHRRILLLEVRCALEQKLTILRFIIRFLPLASKMIFPCWLKYRMELRLLSEVGLVNWSCAASERWLPSLPCILLRRFAITSNLGRNLLYFSCSLVTSVLLDLPRLLVKLSIWSVFFNFSWSIRTFRFNALIITRMHKTTNITSWTMRCVLERLFFWAATGHLSQSTAPPSNVGWEVLCGQNIPAGQSIRVVLVLMVLLCN